ncbi:ACT domain-containing protein [Phosphitispora sp. TUW77]|uniref:ACT domain-containing protein n=1 Tax=Phosphitispora sp. TUW77 TaxID=3152361 RepID=UPI003AB795B3
MFEYKSSGSEGSSNRVIITVLGKDKVGIIAGVSVVLAENNVNILDISQTILQDMFTMVMVCDITYCKVEFGALKDRLEGKGREIGVQIQVQHEDVFKFMHRI